MVPIDDEVYVTPFNIRSGVVSPIETNILKDSVCEMCVYRYISYSKYFLLICNCYTHIRRTTLHIQDISLPSLVIPFVLISFVSTYVFIVKCFLVEMCILKLEQKMGWRWVCLGSGNHFVWHYVNCIYIISLLFSFLAQQLNMNV